MYTIHETDEHGATIHELFRLGTTDRDKLVSETLKHCGFELRKGTMAERVARAQAVSEGIDEGQFAIAGKFFKVFAKNADGKFVAVSKPEPVVESAGKAIGNSNGSSATVVPPTLSLTAEDDKCIACGGSGESTSGHKCPICNGSGKKVSAQELKERVEHMEQAKATLHDITTASLPKVAPTTAVNNDQRIVFIKAYSAEIDRQYRDALRNAFADLKRSEGNLKQPFFSKPEKATCIFCERPLRADHPLTIKGSTEGDMAIYAHGFCLRDAIAVDPTKAALAFYASFRLKMKDSDLRAVLREWATIEATVTMLMRQNLKAPEAVMIAVDKSERLPNVVIPEVTQETAVTDVAAAAFAERNWKASADSVAGQIREAFSMPKPDGAKTLELTEHEPSEDEGEEQEVDGEIWIS